MNARAPGEALPVRGLRRHPRHRDSQLPACAGPAGQQVLGPQDLPVAHHLGLDGDAQPVRRVAIASLAQRLDAQVVTHLGAAMRRTRQCEERFFRLHAEEEPPRPMVEPRVRAAVERHELGTARRITRSEEHTSELQSQSNLVCRLLLEKKKKKTSTQHTKPSKNHQPQPTDSKQALNCHPTPTAANMTNQRTATPTTSH